jgi:hypothetical protein
MGSVSDTEYILKGGVFEMQDDFVKERDPLSVAKPWLIMLDRGYRNIGGHAYQHGCQMVVQPSFS